MRAEDFARSWTDTVALYRFPVRAKSRKSHPTIPERLPKRQRTGRTPRLGGVSMRAEDFAPVSWTMPSRRWGAGPAFAIAEKSNYPGTNLVAHASY
jgi:hypothetical protein